MRIGAKVKLNSHPRRTGRVVHWRKGLALALVKWDDGACTQHHWAALTQVSNR